MTYPTDPATEEHHVDLDATPARQGMRGVHILWVLIISFILAAAALFGSWAWKSGDLQSVDHNVRAQPSEAKSFDTSAGGPVLQNNEH